LFNCRPLQSWKTSEQCENIKNNRITIRKRFKFSTSQIRAQGITLYSSRWKTFVSLSVRVDETRPQKIVASLSSTSEPLSLENSSSVQFKPARTPKQRPSEQNQISILFPEKKTQTEKITYKSLLEEAFNFFNNSSHRWIFTLNRLELLASLLLWTTCLIVLSVMWLCVSLVFPLMFLFFGFLISGWVPATTADQFCSASSDWSQAKKKGFQCFCIHP